MKSPIRFFLAGAVLAGVLVSWVPVFADGGTSARGTKSGASKRLAKLEAWRDETQQYINFLKKCQSTVVGITSYGTSSYGYLYEGQEGMFNTTALDFDGKNPHAWVLNVRDHCVSGQSGSSSSLAPFTPKNVETHR